MVESNPKGENIMRRRNAILITVLTIALLLAACGKNPAVTTVVPDTTTPMATETPDPSDAPVPTEETMPSTVPDMSASDTPVPTEEILPLKR